MIEGHTMGFWVVFTIIMVVLIIVGLAGLSYLIEELVMDVRNWIRRHNAEKS